MKSSKLKLKTKNYLLRFWPFLFIGLIWFIFANPYFIKGLVPFPSTYQVNHYPPWTSYEKYWGPVKNGAMPDIIDQIYPWRHFTVAQWLSHRLPVWNPNNFAGNPHIGNFQSAVFSPFNILFVFLSFIDAWSILVLFQPLLAGIGMYFFARCLSVSRVGATISAIVFMFSGFMVTWMAYGTLSMAIAFLPLLLFAIEKAFNRFRIKYGLLISFCLAASFFSGHFQTSLYLLLFSIAYLLYKYFSTKKRNEGIKIILFFCIGLAISLLQLLPSIELYLYSVRSENYITSGGIPIQYIVTSISPDFFGNPVTRNDWFGQYAEWASFVGIVPLTLALVALFGRKNRSILFFFFSAVIILILAIQSPLLPFIGALKIPVLSTSTPSRIIVLFSFAIAVLAGYGFDGLLQHAEQKNIKKIIPVFLSFGAILLLIWLALFLRVLPADKTQIAQRNFILPTALFAGLFFISFFQIFERKIRHTHLTFYLIILLVAFDSFRFAQKWMPFDPKQLVYPDVPVIAAMQKHIGYGRYFGNLGAQVATYYNLPSIEGYDPLYSQRYGEFIQTATTGKFTPAMRSVAMLERNGLYTDRVLDTLGVTLIFHPIADTEQSWAYPVWKDQQKYTRIYTDGKFQLFRNNDAINRPTLYYKYEIISDKEKMLKRFYSQDFYYRDILLLEEKPELESANTISQSARKTAWIVSSSPSRITIQAETEAPALLFLSDNYYPGWQARVNGKMRKIYRADYTFRAVVVPKGKSTVEFYYQEYF